MAITAMGDKNHSRHMLFSEFEGIFIKFVLAIYGCHDRRENSQSCNDFQMLFGCGLWWNFA